jgi:hypothetical protein
MGMKVTLKAKYQRGVTKRLGSSVKKARKKAQASKKKR